MATSNTLFITLAAGETFTLPDGFLSASIYPASGASFTITNSLGGEIEGVSLQVSAAIDTVYTFGQPPSLEGWANHIITASGGQVTITYATGR